MSIELYIKEEADGLCDKVYIAPDIAEKKLNGAISGMTNGLNPDYVLAIADTTIFGGAKEGCLFTGQHLYIHAIASDKIEINLSHISKVNYSVTKKKNDKGKIEKIERLILDMQDGSKIDISNDINGLDVRHLSDMLEKIVDMGKEEEFTTTAQTAPLSMMEDDIKLNYMKLICNFTFTDNGIIDGKAYAEIISLAVRIELQTSSRMVLRAYTANYKNVEDNSDLLSYISNKVGKDSFEIIKQSLIKDILNLYRTKNKNAIWNDNSFIVYMVNQLEIEEEQVDIMEQAIINEEDILLLRKNDSEIEKSMKDLVAKAGAVGVPLAAIYLSGSVIGVSAAGITSGLATLGMGGLLGFSSMFTGIGVAVLKGLETQDKIEELTDMLKMLSNGASSMSNKINYAEKETVITRLPMKLDVSRLNELTNTPTRTKYRETVMSGYNEETVEQKDGSLKTEYMLNDGLNVDDLDNLYNIFEEIGYNKLSDATVASLKGATRDFMGGFRGKE